MGNLDREIDLMLERSQRRYECLDQQIDLMLEGSLSEYIRAGNLDRSAKKGETSQEEEELTDDEPTEEMPREDDELGDDEETEEVSHDIDCEQLLKDPEIQKLLKNIEASQTIKRQLADTLRNLSLTIDITTGSIAAAMALLSTPTPGAPVGWLTAAGILKWGGLGSAGSLLGAVAFDLMNGDYKVAAIDGAGAVLSAWLAGGGAASKAAKSVGARLLQRGAGKLAQLEAKLAAELATKGISEQLAKTIAKKFMTGVINNASGSLRKMIGDIPTIRDGESDHDYKQRVQHWQQEQSKKVAEIFNKCYKKTEDTQTTKNIKKAIKEVDKFVNFMAHWIDRVLDFGFKLIKGGNLNESQLRVAEELGLGDIQLLKEDKLTTITIDFNELRKQELNESFLAMFGGWIEYILGAMFGGRSLPLSVKGSRREVESFAKAIGGEKKYLEVVRRYGLDHPTTYKNKAKLDNAIKGFEKETGLKWPFK